MQLEVEEKTVKILRKLPWLLVVVGAMSGAQNARAQAPTITSPTSATPITGGAALTVKGSAATTAYLVRVTIIGQPGSQSTNPTVVPPATVPTWSVTITTPTTPGTYTIQAEAFTYGGTPLGKSTVDITVP